MKMLHADSFKNLFLLMWDTVGPYNCKIGKRLLDSSEDDC